MSLLGLQQYYACSENASKTRTLLKFIGEWKFNQAIIFVSNSRRCDVLAHILNKLDRSTISIHKGLTQVERMSRYKEFIDAQKQILVTTNLFGRGMNNHRINLVINYDTPNSTISYLHRATRARPASEDAKILTLVCSEKEANLLTAVQEQFEVDIRKIEDISANDNVNLESSLLWAEDTMNQLCAEFEKVKFL
jgi:superfamily II DNA/RNA helicase